MNVNHKAEDLCTMTESDSYPFANGRSRTMLICGMFIQDQDSLLVKRRNDNHSPVAFDQTIGEVQFRSKICVEADKIASFFHFNKCCTCLTHIRCILITRFASAFCASQNSIARFLKFCLVLKRNKTFCTTGLTMPKHE